jgi:hypothetical protein
MDPVRPDLIPMSDPMNQVGLGGGPLDLSGGPPFPFLQLPAATTSSLLGHLVKTGGLHPDLQSLGMLLPPTSLGLTGAIFIFF